MVTGRPKKLEILLSEHKRKELHSLYKSRSFPAGIARNVLIFLLFLAWIVPGNGISQTPAEETTHSSAGVEMQGEESLQEEKPLIQGEDVSISAEDPVLNLEGLLPRQVEVTEIRNVTYSEGLLSVDFRGVPAGEALEKIAQLAGFEVVTHESISNTPLTIRFSSEPLEKGLTLIIRHLETGNYRYYFTADGALKSVVVAASGESLPSQPDKVLSTGTRTRSVIQTQTGAQRPIDVRSRTVRARTNPMSTESTTVTQEPNVVRGQTVTPNETKNVRVQGYLGKTWLAPHEIPATPER